MTVADPAPSWKPSVAAAVLLVARELAPALTAGWSVADILAATDAARSQAYAMRPRVVAACAALDRPPGRPAHDENRDAVLDCACRVRDFLADHPGAVAGRGERRRYSDGFRRFVLALAAPGEPAADLTAEQLAAATGVPLGTLKDWRRESPDASDEPPDEPRDDAPPPPRPVEWTDLAGHPRIATLLDAYQHWQGDFTTFYEHARAHLRLPWGRTFIARLLEAAGLREPRRRRQPRPTWNRDTFRRLFPGAQWLGDGTTLAIQLDGQWHLFNLEAVLDVDSNAVVGIHVGDTEDEDAVRQAFLHGEATTGGRPVALTLDGKPCNHTDALAGAVRPSVVVPATPARGQAKAPLEGAFGLFRQTAPPLSVHGNDERERARSILELVLLVWYWARNGKPRRRLGGRSPADYYRDAAPSPEERAAAQAWATELQRRYDRFCDTRRRRADPVRRTLLREALQRLGLDDPDDRLATDLARYATDAILFGIALLDAKKANGKLAELDQPGRYLAAVIRNKDTEAELEHTAARLLELRLRHRDLCLAPLQRRVEHLRATLPALQRPRALLDRALGAKRLIDFRFYAAAVTRALDDLDPRDARALYPHLVRRVAVSHRVERPRRERLIAALADAITKRGA